MSVATQPMSADEFFELSSRDGRRELVRGEVRELSPAGSRHGQYAGRLYGLLFQHVEANGLGTLYAAETGFQIARDPDTVLAPDVAFVGKERADALGQTDGFFPAHPDLAVEVVSPNDRNTEVVAKVYQWLDAGCRMVVVVDPRRRTVSVHRSRVDVVALTEADALDGGDVVPGWRLPLSDLFA